LRRYRRETSLAAGLELWDATVPAEVRRALFADDFELARALAGKLETRQPRLSSSLRRLPKVAKMLGRIKLARRRARSGAGRS
jgi:hypothetical protein